MNYYRRYVGDYLRDTARLSMLEHGAYNLLLDYYYAEERPIPLELDEVYRMVRAIMPEERRAVQKVLTTFFQHTDDGWRHKRVDEEIEKGASAIEQMAEAGKKGAEARWGKDRAPHKKNGARHRVGYAGGDGGTDAGVDAGDDTSSNHQPPSSSLQPPTTRKEPSAPSSFALDAGGAVNGHDRDDPVVERIPLCDGSEFGVPKSLRDELDRLYPAVGPDQTLREIRGWCLANPKRRKTVRGVKSFITSWFAREQDRQSRRAA